MSRKPARTAPAGTSLFEESAPRPLADRLRPQTLSDVVGQDHLLKGDGPLARMVAQRRLASIDPVGPAGLRQDDHRPAAGAKPSISNSCRSRRCSPASPTCARSSPRRGVAARGGQGHAAVHRRDPPLQPLAAGWLPALCRERHGHPDRRHDREPVVRAERRVAVAHAGARAPPPRRGRPGDAAGARRGRNEAQAAARTPMRARP